MSNICEKCGVDLSERDIKDYRKTCIKCRRFRLLFAEIFIGFALLLITLWYWAYTWTEFIRLGKIT
ncbi:MAG: hypothetical protein KGD63_11550 [Candidatus Lokiarchaeota archaeon]|nr:hypothetical protein [Candidatus Lokiarchaeota archaeon]